MGQKINPTGFRMGHFLPWKSRWYAEGGQYQQYLLEDVAVRKALMERLKLSGVNSVEIERLPQSMVISIYVARPGVVIGRGGTGIEEVKKFIIGEIRKVRGSLPKDLKIDLKVNEVKNPDLSAHLVAERITSDLERRMPYRLIIARTMDRIMQSGAKGVRVVLGGRINGAEISRREKFHRGSVPTQTLREDVDYAEARALLKRGYVGVKVWIHDPEEK